MAGDDARHQGDRCIHRRKAGGRTAGGYRKAAKTGSAGTVWGTGSGKGEGGVAAVKSVLQRARRPVRHGEREDAPILSRALYTAGGDRLFAVDSAQ